MLDAFPFMHAQTMNNRKQQTDTPKTKDARQLALAPAEEVSPPPELQQNQRNQRKGRKERGKRATPRDAYSLAFASAEEMSPLPKNSVVIPPTSPNENLRTAQPGAVATGPTRPPVLSEPRGPSAFDQTVLIVAEPVEPSQEEEELRRRLQFWIGAALVLLLVVGVLLGVVVPLTTNKDNDKDSLSIDSVVTPTKAPTTQAPTANATPTKSPAPTACTSRECQLREILLQNEVANANTLQDESSPQFLALRGLANEDNTLLDLDSTPTMIIVERYVLAVLYFATNAKGVSNWLNFLFVSSVCGLNEVSCNGNDLVVALDLGKSKHGEVIVLISKDRTWIGFSIS
jgi:hypothetical protein